MIGWLEIKIERRDGAATMSLGPLDLELVPRAGERFHYPGLGADDGDWFAEKIESVEWYGVEQVTLICESDDDSSDYYDTDDLWDCGRPQWLQEEIDFRMRNGWKVEGERRTFWDEDRWGLAYEWDDFLYDGLVFRKEAPEP